jgi:hypothetical protein
MNTRRLVASLAFVSLLMAGCAQQAEPQETAVVTRPGKLQACPDLGVAHLPAGVRLRDRELPNLGDGVLGRVVKYGDGQRLIAVHAGVDPLEALEDLDFEPQMLESAGRRYVVSRTPLDSALIVASWEDESVDEPCGELAVMTRGFSLEELVPILDSVALVE